MIWSRLVAGLDRAPLCLMGRGDPMSAAKAAWLLTNSNERIRFAVVPPAAEPRGSVILSPGRSEPIEKYGETASELAAKGFVVLIHEWAGQGLSGRYHRDSLRSHAVGGWERPLAHYRDLLDHAAGELPKPWIGVGHSMGGALIALALAEGEDRLDAALLSAPMIGINTGRMSFARARLLANVACAIGFGGRLVMRQVDPADRPFENNRLTHDRTRYQRARDLFRDNTALRSGEPTYAWLRFALGLQHRFASFGPLPTVTTPVTMLLAEEETLVDNRAARGLCGKLPHCSAIEVPQARHEIPMEVDEARAYFWRAFDGLVENLP